MDAPRKGIFHTTATVHYLGGQLKVLITPHPVASCNGANGLSSGLSDGGWMRSFRGSELQRRIEGHFGSSGGDPGAYDMVLGQDYHRLAQTSEQQVLPEKMKKWFVYCGAKVEQVSKVQKGNPFGSPPFGFFTIYIYVRNITITYYSTHEQLSKCKSIGADF